MTTKNPLPHSDTEARFMLSDAIAARRRADKASLRMLAAEMEMSSAMLSHMATGRIPIPVDGAAKLADALGISRSEFVKSVLKQRFPNAMAILDDEADVGGNDGSEVTRARMMVTFYDGTPPTGDLALILDQVRTADDAQERWLTPSELPVVNMIRRLRPNFSKLGLTEVDLDLIKKVFTRN